MPPSQTAAPVIATASAVAPTQDQRTRQHRITAQAQTLATTLFECCPPESVEYQNALNALRLAVMWSNEAIVAPTIMAQSTRVQGAS